MNVLSELEIGDKLSIEIIEKDVYQSENNILNAQLIDIDANYLYISPPVYKGKKYSLNNNQTITIFFYRNKGVYQFNAQMVNQINTNIITFVLKPLGNMQKIQRRNYYRLPITIPVILKKQRNNTIDKFECITKDISGSGAKLVCKCEIEKFDSVVVDIFIDEKQVVTMDGEVIRVIKNIESNNYELGIKFKESNGMGIDKLIAFIFEKQRLLRKKGLI